MPPLSDLSLVMTLGVISSLHCVQMCGPIVLSYGMAIGGQGRFRQLLAHLAYTAGRLTTYGALGAVAGGLGSGVDLAGRLAGMRNAAAIVAGCLLFAGGILVASGSRFGQRAAWTLPATAVGRLIRSQTVRSKLAMGLVLGLLPCGLVYAVLLKSVETAGPVRGAVTMFAFGTGTSVALLAIGVFSSTIGRRLGRYSTRLAGAAVALTGILLLCRGLLPPPASCCH